jgi:hypothetical protein
MSKNWKDKYKLVGIIPGRIFLPGLGEIDLANEKTPIEKVDEAYRRGCKYLQPIIDPIPDREPAAVMADEKTAPAAAVRKSKSKQ